jgi:hypothetical protein
MTPKETYEQKIVRQFLEGETMQALSDRYGLRLVRVEQIIKKALGNIGGADERTTPRGA